MKYTYKQLFNIASDYILFNTNNGGYAGFIKEYNLTSDKLTLNAYKNAYKQLLYICNH